MAKYKAPFRLVKPTKKGGIYYYRLGDDPKRTRHSTGCRTEKDAQAYCQKITAVDENGVKEVLFGDFSANMFIVGKCPYLANKVSDGKPVTAKLTADYRAYIENYILPYFKEILLSSITPAEVRRWRNSIMDGSFKPKSLRASPPAHETMNKVRRVFEIVMNEAEDEGLIKSNPVSKVSPLSKQVYKKRDALTKEEVDLLFPDNDEDLLRIWGDYEKASMLYLVLTSGMRSGELRALKWSDIDWKNKGVRVTKAITAEQKLGPTKGKKARGTVPPSRTFELLKKWLELAGKSEPDAFVFAGSDGFSPSSSGRLRCALRNAMQHAGINTDGRKNIVVHSLRHTYNTLLYTVLPSDALRGTIGHESEAMTQRYAHLTPDEAIKQYGKKYRKAIEKTW